MKCLFHTSKASLTCREIERYLADGFTSPLKEGVLRIFIVLKNSSPSAGFEPVNFESNGKMKYLKQILKRGVKYVLSIVSGNEY
jgi:hypothetical protein